jgi:hypothetical protein
VRPAHHGPVVLYLLLLPPRTHSASGCPAPGAARPNGGAVNERVTSPKRACSGSSDGAGVHWAPLRYGRLDLRLGGVLPPLGTPIHMEVPVVLKKFLADIPLT